MSKRSRFVSAVCVSITSLVSASAHAQAIITNSAGLIKLGVNPLGQLNVEGGSPSAQGNRLAGLRYLKPGTGNEYEYTADGIPAEGWGVAGDNSFSGFANNAFGSGGLTPVSFSSTANAATVVVTTGSGSKQLTVTHEYGDSLSSHLMQDKVTITNTGSGTVSSVLYRRVMDWDIETTAYNEHVSIQGWPATALQYTSDNGFASSNPLSAGGTIGAPINSNFGFLGPFDHGAVFDFGFGNLAEGESITFFTFYGGDDNENAAINDLATVGAGVYSLAHPDLNSMDPNYTVAIFGFKGVGGTVVGAVPEPNPFVAGLLILAGLGLGVLRGRRSRC